MNEYVLCGIVAFLGLIFFVALNVAKAKIGWSWVGFNEKEEE